MKQIKELDFPEIKLKDIQSAYEGKTGCMCGCNGEYYVPAVNKKEADRRRGYTLDNANDDKVRRILNVLKKNHNSVELQEGMERDILIYDYGNSRWAIYLMGRCKWK